MKDEILREDIASFIKLKYMIILLEAEGKFNTRSAKTPILRKATITRYHGLHSVFNKVCKGLPMIKIIEYCKKTVVKKSIDSKVFHESLIKYLKHLCQNQQRIVYHALGLRMDNERDININQALKFFGLKDNEIYLSAYCTNINAINHETLDSNINNMGIIKEDICDPARIYGIDKWVKPKRKPLSLPIIEPPIMEPYINPYSYPYPVHPPPFVPHFMPQIRIRPPFRCEDCEKEGVYTTINHQYPLKVESDYDNDINMVNNDNNNNNQALKPEIRRLTQSNEELRREVWDLQRQIYERHLYFQANLNHYYQY